MLLYRALCMTRAFCATCKSCTSKVCACILFACFSYTCTTITPPCLCISLLVQSRRRAVRHQLCNIGNHEEDCCLLQKLDIRTQQHRKAACIAGGRRTMYAGLTPTLIRAFPANAAQWLAWELSRRCNTYHYCVLTLCSALRSPKTSLNRLNSYFHA